MKFHGFTPIFYIIALILAIVSQESEACDYQEPEPIKIEIMVG